MAKALADAQSRGIAEPDPTMDVDGWDTAAKLLIISNAVMGTGFRLAEVGVSGIRDIAPHLVPKAAEAGKGAPAHGEVLQGGPDAPLEARGRAGPPRRRPSAVRGPRDDQGHHLLHGHDGPGHGHRRPLGSPGDRRRPAQGHHQHLRVARPAPEIDPPPVS